MAGDDATPASALPAFGDSPFDPLGIAKVGPPGSARSPTVRTPAIERALRTLDDHLQDRPGSDRLVAGQVLTVIGDYGSGKTQLLVELWHRARSRPGAVPDVYYVDTPPDSLTGLYHRLLTQIGRAPLLSRLRAATAPPGPVLTTRLDHLSRGPEFVTAFESLLDPALESPAWWWLSGEAPDPGLEARGISGPLHTDDDAVQAITAVLTALGLDHPRGVLIIDEIERLWASTDASRKLNHAVSQLVTDLAQRGFLVVIAGLPEVAALIAAHPQEPYLTLWMDTLSVESVKALITQSQLAAGGTAALEPFTEESVEYLVQLTGGNPRQVHRMAYLAHQRAQETAGPVTEDIIRWTAQTLDAATSAGNVRSMISVLLRHEGLSYVPHHVLELTMHARVDFWAYLDDRSVGFGIIVADSIAGADILGPLERRARAIQNASPGTEVIVVVNGILRDATALRLTELFGQPPVRFDPRTFADDFDVVLREAAHRLHAVGGGDPLRAVMERVDRLNRQHRSSSQLLEQLTAQMEALRGASERRFELVSRSLNELQQTVELRPASERARPGPTPTLPVAVRQLFTEAFSSLTEVAGLSGLEQVFEQSFSPAPRGWIPTGTPSSVVGASLRSHRVAGAIGVAVFLHRLVESFHNGVLHWYQSRIADQPGPPGTEDYAALRILCRTYDDFYDALPLADLAGLGDFLPARTARDDDFEQTARFVPRTSSRNVLRQLGSRVQELLSETMSRRAAQA
jgi:hypothetical protein